MKTKARGVVRNLQLLSRAIAYGLVFPQPIRVIKMKKTNRTNALVNLIQGILLTVALAATAAAAEGVSAPNELMKKLDMLKGTWVGDAKGTGPDGKPYQVRQTERVGAMLNGDVLVIEGRGYKSDGSLAFNAFGTVAADVKTGAYEFHAYTQGRSGTFRMESIPTGVVWELPAGPNATMRYTINIVDGVWHEVGEYLAKDKPPRQIIEMTLKRTGDTDWPSAQPVKP